MNIGMRVWFNGRTSAFQAEDAGSIPATRSIIRTTLNGFWLEKVTAHIAQSVEHFLGKEEVIGSNPIVSTIFFIFSNILVWIFLLIYIRSPTFRI